MTYSTSKSTVAAAALATRVSIEERRREQDTRLTALNTARAHQRTDGRQEMRDQVAESLLHIKYQEEGYSWKEARDMARQAMAARNGTLA